MFDLIRAHQLNIMLILCGGCSILVLLLLITRFLSRSRKIILIIMELIALFLLWFDRAAYIYAGDPSRTGYIMVRVSNFIVFFMTSAILLGFNLYLTDLLTHEGGLTVRPKRLAVTAALGIIGMCLAVISAFTGLYYYFDETNLYHRGSGFLIAYIIPVVCPILQYTVVRQYKKLFSKLIYISMVLYIFVPVGCGILQIFTYGISIVNMSMVAVSISLYIFMYLDLNNTVEHAHEIEIEHMQGEQKKMQRLFDQTATAFVSAVEKKDEYLKGNALKVAEYSKRMASLAGKDEEYCEKVYYAALLHDVGLIGIPDEVIAGENEAGGAGNEMMKRKPEIGREILSSITEYPYLAQVAYYSHEMYNGTGYPEGIKGEDIPEIARIIAVADAYVSMSTKKRYRDELPHFVAREEFIKRAGEEFDPTYCEIMARIIDADYNENPEEKDREVETEITCKDYRERVTRGIEVEEAVKTITFDFERVADNDASFSSPSIVLFDSYDARTHNDERSIEAYHYLEYAEIWFDRYSVSTAARNIEEKITEDESLAGGTDNASGYSIIASRFDDHIKLIMRSKNCTKEVIIALPNSSNSAYIGITGENCSIRNIREEYTGEKMQPGDITRIAQLVNYTDHLESDIKNIQIDKWRSASTDGIEINGKVKIAFHTMSLPGANLIWHCPYIVLFHSKDGRVGGEDYDEYQMIKINGEDDGNDKPCRNRFSMKKGVGFPGWEKWKEINKEGMECEVLVERRGDQIVIKTDNLGIALENVSSGIDRNQKMFVAFTGDQVALTDIRIL